MRSIDLSVVVNDNKHPRKVFQILKVMTFYTILSM